MPFPLLALFYARNGDSRLAELEACARRTRAGLASPRWHLQPAASHGGDWGPSVLQPLPPNLCHDLLADAAARAVSCRGVFEVWGAGDTPEDCAAATEAVPVEHIHRTIPEGWRAELWVQGARHSAAGRDPGTRMRHFHHILRALQQRPVRLKGPASTICLLEDRRRTPEGAPLPSKLPRFHLLRKLPTQQADSRDLLGTLDLRSRAFLGSSTLDPERALLLCNLGLAGVGDGAPSLLDPFCGSGSILLAAAALGAQTVGSDVDPRCTSSERRPLPIPASPRRPARGTESVRMLDNFEEAGLPPPRDLLPLHMAAPDAAQQLLAANGGAPFHALVTDPPYGRREAVVPLLLPRLLQLARATVAPGGRLVFLAPVRSPRSPHRPSLHDLQHQLDQLALPHGLQQVHLEQSILHDGLHRATVVLERTGP